jgi:TolB-like protein
MRGRSASFAPKAEKVEMGRVRDKGGRVRVRVRVWDKG